MIVGELAEEGRSVPADVAVSEEPFGTHNRRSASAAGTALDAPETPFRALYPERQVRH